MDVIGIGPGHMDDMEMFRSLESMGAVPSHPQDSMSMPSHH